MPDPAIHAVFLSYAREDTVAARRIAEALRGFGVEVWFDQSELRGGDTWDQKIRGQIKDCALFVPVISAATEARGEGYFRLEWKLADERTHLMAKGMPFLLPVVADETRDGEAMVPDSFRAVQWMRLAGGTPTPEFVAQVKRLLEAPRRPAGSRTRESLAENTVARGGQTLTSSATNKPQLSFGVLVAIAVIVIAAAATFFATRKTETAAPPSSNAGAGTRPPTTEMTAPAISTKSIAVLPFSNLSDGKESGYFADGVHEDLLTSLQLIADLKVIGDRSVRQYRETNKSTRQIGEELGVAYVLEGSVRQAGNAVRVVGKLIDARSGHQVWAKSYERDVANVLAIQSELAQAIATALQAVLSPQAKSLIERRPTENAAAYDLFLRARDLGRRFDLNPAQLEIQIGILESVVERDPQFADAWAHLARLHSKIYFDNHDHTAARRAKAQAAIDRAVQLAPDTPVVLGALGAFHFDPTRDPAQAIALFQRQMALQPGNPEPLLQLAAAKRRLLQQPEALRHLQRAAALDPADPRIGYHTVDIFFDLRRYEEAMAEQRRVIALMPNDLGEAFFLVRLAHSATGSKREMETWLATLSAEQRDSALVVSLRKRWASTTGHLDEAIRLDQIQPYFDFADSMDPQGTRRSQAILAALMLASRGEAAAARARLEKYPAQNRERVALDPENPEEWSELSRIELLLGNREEAMRCARKALELVPESVNPHKADRRRSDLAVVQAWSGEKEKALAELARSLQRPSGAKVHILRTDQWWKPLHGDPRFEALLNDPKNPFRIRPP